MDINTSYRTITREQFLGYPKFTVEYSTKHPRCTKAHVAKFG